MRRGTTIIHPERPRRIIYRCAVVRLMAYYCQLFLLPGWLQLWFDFDSTAVRLLKGKGKRSSLDIAPLTIAYWTAALYNLGSGSWLALAIVPRRKLAATHSPRWRTIGPAVCSQQAYYAPINHTIGFHPVIHVPNYMDHYSFTLRDGWLSWPCWLNDSGWRNHKVVTHPASSLAHDRESSPAETSVLTTMLHRQLSNVINVTVT